MNRQVERIRRRATLIPGIWLPAFIADPFRRCPHARQRGIYGDEILMARARARCLDCGRLLQELPPPDRDHAAATFAASRYR